MKKIEKSVGTKKLIRIAKEAKEASRMLATVSTEKKNQVLVTMAQTLVDNKDSILKANKKDLENAKRKGLAPVFIERLSLNGKRISEMAESLWEISRLPDPVGQEIKSWTRPNGLKIQKVRVPIGVILIIYESRPNVTSDCIGLCFKSGNVVILRGGSDAIHSNLSIYHVLEKVIDTCGLPKAVVNFIKITDRKAVGVLLSLDSYIDLVMPRGGESLIKEVKDKSKIPVIKHYKGVCHVYVDAFADIEMARNIVLNAKVQRPAVCNAMETLLVHEAIAEKFLPLIIKDLKEAKVEIRGCLRTGQIVKGVKKATEQDWGMEYLDLILSVKLVKDVGEAIAHINHYGSGHSDSIVTSDRENADKFLKEVDSACVYVNASTRFTDGYQFGLGAEIGISTDRLHARGPMGLEELTTYKYVIRGNGQIRE